jgi:hypothetical protein
MRRIELRRYRLGRQQAQAQGKGQGSQTRLDLGWFCSCRPHVVPLDSVSYNRVNLNEREENRV